MMARCHYCHQCCPTSNNQQAYPQPIDSLLCCHSLGMWWFVVPGEFHSPASFLRDGCVCMTLLIPVWTIHTKDRLAEADCMELIVDCKLQLNSSKDAFQAGIGGGQGVLWIWMSTTFRRGWRTSTSWQCWRAPHPDQCQVWVCTNTQNPPSPTHTHTQARDVQSVWQIEINHTLPGDGAIPSMDVFCSVLYLVFSQTFCLPCVSVTLSKCVKRVNFTQAKLDNCVNFRLWLCVCVEKLNWKISVKKIKTFSSIWEGGGVASAFHQPPDIVPQYKLYTNIKEPTGYLWIILPLPQVVIKSSNVIFNFWALWKKTQKSHCHRHCTSRGQLTLCRVTIIATFLHVDAAVIPAWARYGQQCRGTVISAAASYIIVVAQARGDWRCWGAIATTVLCAPECTTTSHRFLSRFLYIGGLNLDDCIFILSYHNHHRSW